VFVIQDFAVVWAKEIVGKIHTNTSTAESILGNWRFILK
jgi:hypothetical protein